jgi:hypothetical protein
MTRRTGTLAAALALLGLLAGMAQGYRAVAPIDQPQFLQVEPIEVGFSGMSYFGVNMSFNVLKVTWHSGKGLRAGISGLDFNGPLDVNDNGYPNGGSFIPVHVGYDLVFNPKRTSFFYSIVPSCYVEATLGALPLPLYAKLAAVCDIDYYGVGTGIEVGCVDRNHDGFSRRFHPALYASLRFRLLDAAFRLPGRR